MGEPRIPAEAVRAALAAVEADNPVQRQNTDEHDVSVILTAAYPHLAAHILREAATKYEAMRQPNDGPLDHAGQRVAARWLRDRADVLAPSEETTLDPDDSMKGGVSDADEWWSSTARVVTGG